MSEPQDRELLPPGSVLLPRRDPQGPRVQGAVRLCLQSLPQGGRGGTEELWIQLETVCDIMVFSRAGLES